jgi:hypothetical protein
MYHLGKVIHRHWFVNILMNVSHYFCNQLNLPPLLQKKPQFAAPLITQQAILFDSPAIL